MPWARASPAISGPPCLLRVAAGVILYNCLVHLRSGFVAPQSSETLLPRRETDQAAHIAERAHW
jgi:hypothetical protein